MSRFFSAAIGTATAVFWVCNAGAGTVTVLTSFSNEVTDVYKAQFEKKHPDIKLEFLQKNTTAAIAFIREQAAGQRPDVMWVSAPDAFEVLKRDGLLDRVPEVRNKFVPAKIGSYPINDPDFAYFGQALSGYGIMTNTRYMQTQRLPQPKEWTDLMRAAYFGHIAMSSPARSGTTHLTVETILQGEGWDQGWRQLSQIAGNCAAITERSFDVPEGVSSGKYGVGLVIDFFGLSAKYSGSPVKFVYPSMTSVVPASIGLVAGGKNTQEARIFVAYTLSIEGQELLFTPAISRLPVLPYTVAGLKVPGDYPNIYSVARKAKVQFNSAVSKNRRALVSAYFDQTITHSHKELQAATKAIQEVEKKLETAPNAKAAELIRRAREAAYKPILDDKKIAQEQLDEVFSNKKKDAAAGKRVAGLEAEWSAQAKTNYARAEELAREASGALH